MKKRRTIRELSRRIKPYYTKNLKEILGKDYYSLANDMENIIDAYIDNNSICEYYSKFKATAEYYKSFLHCEHSEMTENVIIALLIIKTEEYCIKSINDAYLKQKYKRPKLKTLLTKITTYIVNPTSSTLKAEDVRDFFLPFFTKMQKYGSLPNCEELQRLSDYLEIYTEFYTRIRLDTLDEQSVFSKSLRDLLSYIFCNYEGFHYYSQSDFLEDILTQQ